MNYTKPTHSIEHIKNIMWLDKAEIAKQIKKDLKDTFWKDFKFSVRTSWRQITIEFKTWVIEKESEVFWKALALAIEIWNQYDYDNSDVMTDYFDFNYFLKVSFGDYKQI